MSKESPMNALKEYESQREKIISKYYPRIEGILNIILTGLSQVEEEIAFYKDECEEKTQKAQMLSEIASRFYETAQKILQNPY